MKHDLTKDTVTIPTKEYIGLVKTECELDALEGAGVDNWSGWGEHCDDRDELIKARLGPEFVED